MRLELEKNGLVLQMLCLEPAAADLCLLCHLPRFLPPPPPPHLHQVMVCARDPVMQRVNKHLPTLIHPPKKEEKEGKRVREKNLINKRITIVQTDKQIIDLEFKKP